MRHQVDLHDVAPVGVRNAAVVHAEMPFLRLPDYQRGLDAFRKRILKNRVVLIPEIYFAAVKGPDYTFRGRDRERRAFDAHVVALYAELRLVADDRWRTL